MKVFIFSYKNKHLLQQFNFSVCVKTVDKFANTLSDSIKKDTKKIESEFKKFCKTTKNKENRFVSYKIIVVG